MNKAVCAVHELTYMCLQVSGAAHVGGVATGGHALRRAVLYMQSVLVI